MFYEMLVGMRPFQGESASALFMQHVNLPAPRLPESLARYQGILDRLLAKRPADRFTDALALARALEPLRGS
jgi:serine/threonine-protein kinase PpkA